jgi:hypothetical protein
VSSIVCLSLHPNHEQKESGVTTFVDSTLKEIDDRLRELGDEVTRLEAARAALAGNGRAPASSGARVRPRRPAPDATAAHVPAGESETSRRPGRPRGRSAGTRAKQALELVSHQPGITIPELAKEMKIEPNYLYRVMPRLATEGQVKRDGQGWHPVS